MDAYECSFCKYTTNVKSNLKKHLLTTTHLRIMEFAMTIKEQQEKIEALINNNYEAPRVICNETVEMVRLFKKVIAYKSINKYKSNHLLLTISLNREFHKIFPAYSNRHKIIKQSTEDDYFISHIWSQKIYNCHLEIKKTLSV